MHLRAQILYLILVDFLQSCHLLFHFFHVKLLVFFLWLHPGLDRLVSLSHSACLDASTGHIHLALIYFIRAILCLEEFDSLH